MQEPGRFGVALKRIRITKRPGTSIGKRCRDGRIRRFGHECLI